MKIVYILLLSSLFLLAGCSASSKADKEHLSEDKVKPEERIEGIYAWVNLMPGGPASFHITGRIILDKKEDESIKAGSFEIWQSGKMFYKFVPAFERLAGTAEVDSLYLNRSVYQFSTDSGLELVREFSPDSLVTLKAQFYTESGEVSRQVDSIKVERVY